MKYLFLSNPIQDDRWKIIKFMKNIPIFVNQVIVSSYAFSNLLFNLFDNNFFLILLLSVIIYCIKLFKVLNLFVLIYFFVEIVELFLNFLFRFNLMKY